MIKMNDRTADLIAQIQKHDNTIANIVRSAYERGYADGKGECRMIDESYIESLKVRISILENQMADLLRQDETESVPDVCLTNEEAIEILKSKMDGSVDPSYEFGEAVRMAIRALKEQQAYSEMKKPSGAEMKEVEE